MYSRSDFPSTRGCAQWHRSPRQRRLERCQNSSATGSRFARRLFGPLEERCYFDDQPRRYQVRASGFRNHSGLFGSSQPLAVSLAWRCFSKARSRKHGALQERPHLGTLQAVVRVGSTNRNDSSLLDQRTVPSLVLVQAASFKGAKTKKRANARLAPLQSLSVFLSRPLPSFSCSATDLPARCSREPRSARAARSTVR